MNENHQNEDLIQLGFEILIRELGVARAVRFMQQLHPGQGDYTSEREQWLPTDFDEILKSLAMQETKPQSTIGEPAIGSIEVLVERAPSR